MKKQKNMKMQKKYCKFVCSFNSLMLHNPMGKIPYVLENNLFTRVEYKHAEELLAEYNDFYIFNLAQYQHLYEKTDEKYIENDPDELKEEKLLDIAEHNARAATEHFSTLFGSKDFSESSMVGFRPAWYDLQQILLEEYKYKTPIKESAMNNIAPRLRAVASVMLFAERIVSALENLESNPEVIATVKEGFKLLLERLSVENVNLPEFNKIKASFSKFKKAEQYLEFCEKLFFGGK